MPLNANYVPLTPLWELHSDKDTGDFLRDGFALFYRDTARTVGKPVYQLTGSPPNYSYIQQGYLVTSGSFAGAWRVDLNDQGAFPLMVYGYPLDSGGEVDLYFIQFYSNGGVFQFSREGWPNFFSGGGGNTTQININYVPNGQFLLHTDIPETDILESGEIRQAVTPIAYGGWAFVRPNSSTASDFVTFQRLGSYLTNPPKSPRYACRVKCENPSSGDLFKDLRVRFDDVNKFEYLAQQFTFALTGQILSGGNINVSLILIKNFGTGGDATTETNLTTFTLTGSFDLQFFTFDFGDNTGKVIGTNDDDYIELAIRFPPNSIFDAEITDVILTPGNITNPVFDDTTTRQFIYQSLFRDLVPAHDGSDLGLSPVLGEHGLYFSDALVGKVFASSSINLEYGELLADGSQYETAAYSSEGIPFKRLQSKYFDPTKGMPLYGTGINFVSAYIANGSLASPTNSLRIFNNTAGQTTDFSDGTPPTTFTFTDVTIGTDTGTWGLYYGGNNFFIWAVTAGAVNNPGIDSGTSGFVTAVVRNGRPTVETVVTKAIFQVSTVAATGLAGLYFDFTSAPSSSYRVWFKVNGSGTAPPSAGYTLLEIDLLSTWTAQEVARVIAGALSGSKITNIITKAGNIVPAGSYWNLNTQSQSYYVYYTVDSVGTDPAPPGRLPIMVAILSTDSDIQVASKTLLAINSKYYALPDLRGMFLRGVDGGAGIDLSTAARWSFYNQLISSDQGNLTGSFQFDDIVQHYHNTTPTVSGLSSGGTIPVPTDIFQGSVLTILSSGGPESRPLNANVNWVIKY